MNIHEELSLATGGGSSSQKSQRTSLKLSKLTNGLTNSAITSPTSEVMTNDALNSGSMQHNFHQQIAELQSNLKSVKSLTNLYESKQLSVSPPTTSPNASSSGAPQMPQQNVQYKSPNLQPKQQQPAESTIDFNSIFNKYNNLSSVNLINPTSRNNECLLSSSTSSTSSSSSANQHNQNQTLLDYNNNTLTNKTSEPLNFNSRSLGTFQPTNGNSKPQQHKSSLKSYKNSAMNGSETNLSVKTAVKVFESSSGNSSGLTQGHKHSNTYSSHSSLNHTPKHTLQPSAKQTLTNNNQSNNNLNGSLLSFNKQKRSSSIDNVISSFTSNSNQQFNQGKQNGYLIGNNNTNSKNGSFSKNKEANASFSNPRSSSKLSNNLFLTGTDLKDLLDSFNLNTSKLTGNGGVVENTRPNLEDSYLSQQQGSTIASRSRSLHRDGSSYYMDINGQRKKLIGESSANNTHKLKSTPSSVAAHDQSGYSAFNSSSVISQRSQYESDSNQNVLYNSSDLNSSSHVPKPPPGNPQRNTNLYPAARIRRFRVNNPSGSSSSKSGLGSSKLSSNDKQRIYEDLIDDYENGSGSHRNLKYKSNGSTNNSSHHNLSHHHSHRHNPPTTLY